jgi:ferredoxin--NADP+ reductase
MSIELNAIVLERIEVSPGLIILRVAPGGWELPEFDAGQFAVLGLPGAAPRCDLAMTEESKPDTTRVIKRGCSIASSSVAKKHVEFYLVGSGTRYANCGDAVRS